MSDPKPEDLSLDVAEQDLAGDVRPDATVTWSTDWTTATVIDQLARGRFDLEPAFQRRDVWSDTKRSRFIESLILGIPVPQVILAERQEQRGKFIVLDGKQRLRSLQRFAGLDGAPMRLTGLEVLTNLNGITYEELRSSESLESFSAAFENGAVRAVVLRGWANESLLYLTFLRLNSNVVGLSPQELRRALHPGPFMDYVMQRSSESKPILSFLGVSGPDFRMRDAEILTRHIALTMRLPDYRGDLRAFLDETCRHLNSEWAAYSSAVASCADGLDSALMLTREIWGKNAFKRAGARGQYETRRNRAVLDTMSFYFQHAEVRAEVEGKGKLVEEAFRHECVNNEEFSSSLTATTKSVRAVHARLVDWGRTLSKIAPTAERYIP